MTIPSLINSALYFFNSFLVPGIFAIAFLTFIWGVYTYFIAGAASDEQRETGRKFVMWSIIGLFVMFSLWGIVRVVQNSFGINPATRPCLPSVTGDCSNAQNERANDPWLNDTTRQHECSPNIASTCPSGKVCSQVGSLGEWACI